MDMVEVIARALCNQRCSHVGGADYETLVPGTKNWTFHIHEARAALTAILANLPPESDLKAAQNFYAYSPDGQYDLKVVDPLLEKLLAAHTAARSNEKVTG